MRVLDRRHTRKPGLALFTSLVCLLMAAILPSAAAAAIPGGPGCDFPVIQETTDDTSDTTCAGDLEEVTGVEANGPPAPLPPRVESEEDPLSINRRCARVAGTRSIRSDNVDCDTARSLARRTGKRRRSFRALGFTCQVSGRKVTCYRPASGTDDGDGSDRREAGQVVIVRRGKFPPRECRGSVC